MVPDHWVPITLIARQHSWSRAETARASLQAGFGHVVSTLLIAAFVWLGGVAFAARFGHVVDTATSLALVGFGVWIAVGALHEMHGATPHGGARRHGHGHFPLDTDDDPLHGPVLQRFAINDGELKLSICEREEPPHFRLSGIPIDIARAETSRSDGSRQLFRFENRGEYWESIEEVPEPHQFEVTIMVDHRGHAHSFNGRFTEYDEPVSYQRGAPVPERPEDDKLYAPLAGGRGTTEPHFHLHRHGSAAPHAHWHGHDQATTHIVMAELISPPPLHEHRHPTPARIALLLILGSSPMVEGIPAFFAASKYGFGLLVLMAVVFAISTIATYVLLCVYSTGGLQRVRFGAIERYGEVLSGAFIASVGLIFWFFPVL